MSAANDTRVEIAILGAGPTGIGTAWRLSRSSPTSNGSDHRNGSQPFVLIDESLIPGGRAASFTTPEGFTFDYGGHVLFPHAEYPGFISLLDEAIPAWHYSAPIRGVWIANRLIPTPVQRNIHRLPLPALAECLWGLLRRSPPIDSNGSEPTLQQHLEEQFGEPLTRHVLGPLNRKMWAHDPQHVGSSWSYHRSGSRERNIPEVRVRGVLRNLILNRDEPGWTQSTLVRYPEQGGIGAIWKHIFSLLPSNSHRLGSRVVRLDTKEKIWLDDGSAILYQHLVNSIPLDVFLRLISDRPDLQTREAQFSPAKVQLFGFGLQGTMPEMLRGVHAVNLPEPHIPFWRVNLPSNFSPKNVPDSGTWSILCENSFRHDSGTKHDPAHIEAALRQIGFINPESKVISTFSTELTHGYPVPFAGRDRLLNEVQRELEQLHIYSRGRFGGWRYEVSNQDHAFMQGVEIADRLRTGKPETTYRKTW